MATPAPQETLSCRFIEQNLVLDKDRLMFCCIGRGDTPVGEYHGGPLDAAMITRRREEMRAAVARDEVDPCRGCSHLVKKRWPRSEWLVQSLIIAHFKICNLRCSYCSAFDWTTGPAPNDHYPLLPVVQSMQENDQLAPHAPITWGGGEPTILADFEESLELLGRTRRQQWINTSGVKFSPALYRALETGQVQLQCSIDAGTAATFQEIKERDSLERVWENLQRYAQSGGPVVAKYIVMEQNHTEVDAFLDRVLQAGLTQVVGDLDILSPPSDEALEALGRLHVEGTRRGLSVTLGGGTFRYGSDVHARVLAVLDRQFRSRREELVRRDTPLRRWLGRTVRLVHRLATLAGWRPGGKLSIRSVVPGAGPLRGGNIVYIEGANLHQARSIRFGNLRGEYHVLDPSTARVIVPPFSDEATTDLGAGFHPVDVRLAARHKRSTMLKGYTYCQSPD